MRISLRFLQYQPQVPLSFELPDDMDVEALAFSTLEYNGYCRSVSYLPRRRFGDPLMADTAHRHAFDVRSGAHTVAAYERRTDPFPLSASWRLAAGSLGTFIDIREQTSNDLRAIISAVYVSESDGQIPAVKLSGGVSKGDSRDPANRDRVRFYPSSAGQEFPRLDLIELPKPIDSAGVRYEGDVVIAWQNSRRAVTVECSAPRENERAAAALAGDVAGSLEPSG